MARNRSWSHDVYESYPESDRRRRGRSYEDERRRALTAGPRLTDYGSPEYFAGAEPGRSGTYRGHDDSWERERAYGPAYFGGGGYYRDDDYGERYPYRGRGYGERGFLERASDEVASWLGDEDAERRRELDQHRGKGPKGYTRSDARIQEDVSDRLSDEGMLDASDIAVSVTNGEVQLSGLVDSKWAKRRAEDCAEAVSGVKQVRNNLRIRPSGGSPGWNAGNTDRNIA
ncbi:BON domain-containing protein [Sinorhizobium meliloti]|uniref:BON domain-containing protein n=1 Tax=Rhizobium meliloti TaxID=382 RepID=UPI00299EDFC6|nr:BON domain-containing protein [Sinorhizobium meliloti]MDW9690074.1 BON domain-containing protein [Sinorhizobium meliloti]MDW9714919.1 BON domain-containing protein [Sinorhizobium meliloti]MDW9752144.1 BON domain-containing protein [Sinorhizobium meliloti]